MIRLLLLLGLASQLGDAVEPNILIVYTDDQAARALGLSGHPQASTPNMEKLFPKAPATLQGLGRKLTSRMRAVGNRVADARD